jgi:hypothetical protein
MTEPCLNPNNCYMEYSDADSCCNGQFEHQGLAAGLEKSRQLLM